MTTLNQREEELKKEIKETEETMDIGSAYPHNYSALPKAELKGIQFAQKLQAEKIKELKKVFNPQFEDDWAEKQIDKVFGSDAEGEKK